ncbi:MAG: GNAT family N-acetyltransferase [Desulfobulbaceae bacterium]|nr:GNAT family N-acetyltransferase [Desulfobulbaceae bacterium]
MGWLIIPPQKCLGGTMAIHSGELLGKIWRRCKRYYHLWFCRQNYIFKYDGPILPQQRSDCKYESYESFDELPEHVKVDICADGDASRLEADKLELGENAILWVAFIDGCVATTVFTRKGKHFRRWFLDLQPADVVVFRLRTLPVFRGRGLAPALIRHAIYAQSGTDKSGQAYIDCRTYNKTSKRCIEKAGFKCVATKKAIKREWTLYD